MYSLSRYLLNAFLCQVLGCVAWEDRQGLSAFTEPSSNGEEDSQEAISKWMRTFQTVQQGVSLTGPGCSNPACSPESPVFRGLALEPVWWGCLVGVFSDAWDLGPCCVGLTSVARRAGSWVVSSHVGQPMWLMLNKSPGHEGSGPLP